MTAKIVEDIVGGESRASAVAKMRAMIESKLGTGSAASAETFGQLRGMLNDGAPADAQIQNGELGGSVRAKLNGWHNAAPLALQQPPQITPGSAEVGATFTVTPGSYEGAGPIQISGELTQGGVVVATRANGVPFSFASTAPGPLQWTETAQNIKGQAPAAVATATVQAPQQISDFYGVGAGQIPMDHIYAQGTNVGGNITAVANSGGAGATFNLSAVGTIPQTDNFVTLDPTDRFDVANRAEFIGTRLFVVADIFNTTNNQVFAGSNTSGDVTNVQLNAGGGVMRVQRNAGSGFVNADVPLSPVVSTGLRIYEIEVISGGNVTVWVNGQQRGTLVNPHTTFGIRRIAAGQGSTSGLRANLYRTLSLITGGDYAARVPVIRNALAAQYGITL